MLLSGINNIVTYRKWFCATELYAIKRNMLRTGMGLSGVDCIQKPNILHVSAILDLYSRQ